MINRTAMLSLLALFLYFPIFSQIIYVSEDGTGDGSSWNQAAGDLREVLLNAQPGDEVWVSSGTYRPDECSDCDRDDRDDSFEIPNQVQVYGGFSGTETQRLERDWLNNETILSGDIDQDDSPDDNAFTIVYFENVDSTTIIDGFTIRDGIADDMSSSAEDPGRSGGGIYNNGSIHSAPIIRHCKFIDHFGDSYGAAIYNNGSNGGSASSIIRDCSFTGNHAVRSGGAIFNDGSYLQGESSPTIDHCFFQDNTSIFGGAIYNNGFGGVASPRILNSTFTENTGTSIAGAVYSFAKDSLGLVAPLFANCLFVDNFGKSSGAVYTLSSGGKARPLLFNCVFYENSANTGGAVYCNESDQGDTEVTMYNNIFVGNTANHNPIFHMSGSGTPTMKLYSSMVDAADCEDIAQVGDEDSLFCGAGIIYNQDPLFVDPDNFDFHLQPTSPAVDAGDNQIVLDNDIPYDIDSLVRILNGQVDMGIFELNNAIYVPTNFATQPISQNTCEDEDVFFNIQTSGTDPLSYQWFKNGQPISGAVEEDLFLNNIMVSDTGTYFLEIVTASGETLTSDIASLSALEVGTPALAIVASNDNICTNTPVTFTINTIDFEGDAPTFQWLRNDEEVGLNQPSYTTQSLSDGDEVRCVLTSSRNCVTTDLVFSNTVFMDVSTVVTPEINITADALEICAADPVTFNADIDNGGTAPQIDWLRNGVVISQNTNTITLNDLNSDDIIEAKIISSEDCASSQPVFSNEISVDVTALASMSIDITSNSQNICQGEMVTFTANSENGGPNPTYEWFVNSQNSGVTGSVFNTDNLNNNDQVSCQITSTESCLEENILISDLIEMTVNPLLEVVAEIISDQSEICSGESANFTSMVTNGGMNPTYQWLVNGVEVGQNMSTFSTNNLNDGDQVSCRITSTESCLIENIITTDPVEVTVNPILSVFAEIDTDQTEICEGALVNFTSMITNGGPNPAYQWLVNGVEVGQNMSTFSADNLNDGDQVSCQITSTELCLEENIVTSGAIEINVNPNLPFFGEIAADQTEICQGALVNFTSTVTNGGNDPTYQWMINDNPVGQNISTFSSDNLNNGDEVSLIISSTESCISTSTITTSGINILVNPILPLMVSISADVTTICEGESATFTAHPVNAGSNPEYQWTLNGVSVGNNIDIYTATELTEADQVRCQITTSEPCLSSNVVTSEPLSISLTELVLPSISILTTTDEICETESAIFTAQITDGGTSPSIQWFLNSIEIGTGEMSLTLDQLSSDDIITASVISSSNCASSEPVLSENISVTVIEIQALSIIVTAEEETICPGELVTFTATTQNEGANPTYLWTINGTEVPDNNAPILQEVVTENSDVFCTLISSRNCVNENIISSGTYSITVTQPINPMISIILTEDSICMNQVLSFSAETSQEGIGSQIEWFVNGTTTGDFGPFFTIDDLAEGDLVTAVLLIGEECTTASSITSNEININFSNCNTVGIETIVDNKNIKVFPNPAAEKFDINLTDFHGKININIHDLYGRLFFQKEVFINQNYFSVPIDSQSFPAGTYFISLKDENTNNVTRVIIR